MARVHRRTIQKVLNDSGVVTHLEPDTLEGKVKWTLGSTTTRKLVEMMEFHQLFQILKDHAVKVNFSHYARKFRKLSSGNRNGKGQLHSNLKERQCQRTLKLLYNCVYYTCKQGNSQNPSIRLQQYVNQELPDVQAEFRKSRWTWDQMANTH